MSVETGQRPGLTGCHMSHQRQHHICLDMGRTIIGHTCIALMAELWCDILVNWSRPDQITLECSRPPMRSVMMSPSQSFMYIYLRIPSWMISPFSSLFDHHHQQQVSLLLSPQGKIRVALYSIEYTICALLKDVYGELGGNCLFARIGLTAPLHLQGNRRGPGGWKQVSNYQGAPSFHRGNWYTSIQLSTP